MSVVAVNSSRRQPLQGSGGSPSWRDKGKSAAEAASIAATAPEFVPLTENGRHGHHGRKNQQNSLPPPRAAVERRSSTAMTDTNVTDQQSRGAFGSHAPHAGPAPRSTGAIQRVSPSLILAVARFLPPRIPLAPPAAAEPKSRRPHLVP